MKLRVYIEKKEFIEPVRYAFRELFRPLDAALAFVELAGDADILYSASPVDEGTRLRIVPDERFWAHFKTPAALPAVPLARYEGLPVLYGDTAVESARGGISCRIDVIASALFMLSRYEEYFAECADEHERFAAAESVASKEGFVDVPLVDRCRALVVTLLGSLGHTVAFRDLWDGNEFAAFLSSDVDAVKKADSPLAALRYSAGDLLKRRDPRAAAKRISEAARSAADHTRDPYWTFDYLMDVQDGAGFTSTFFLPAALEKLGELCGLLARRGREIGAHFSYDSHRDAACMKEELASLQRRTPDNITGSRQHYLRFRAGETLEALDECGILYDATLGYADSIGFRAGTCHPFRVYSLKQGTELDIYAIPLTVMDMTLANYLQLEPEAALAAVKELIGRVKQSRGVFSLLWHNSFIPDQGKEWREVYEETVSHLADEGAAGLAGRDIIARAAGTETGAP